MTMPTRLDPIPDDAAKVIADAAKAHGVEVNAMFPDYSTMQKGDKARQEAARGLAKIGYEVTVIARWFGVSRVAINNAVKESR
jgi:hypothetical protein